jgi:beta-glucosidase
MDKIKFFLLLTIGLVLMTGWINAQQPKLNENTLEEVVSAMTLKEKALLVVGTGMYMELPDSLQAMAANFFGSGEQLKQISTDYAGMVERIRKLVPGAAGRTAAIDDYGIPTMIMADGPAGLRISPQRKNDNKTYFCTAFPIATELASTWDTYLVREVGKAMGNEVLEYGADVLLAPGMNIQRDPLCGRNFEYYSEDPLVTGKMAAAMVNGIQSQGVGTSVKHFAANNQETQRNTVNTIVSERALREIYLEGFRIAVEEAQPWTVMSSYNKINGEYASESHDLLTKILREDWGFKGYVVTDWGAGTNVVKRMEAGNDLIMPGNTGQIEGIIAAVEEGTLSESVLDRNIKRILTVLLKTPKYKGYEYSNNPDLTAHTDLARKAASQGMVLLKNNGDALPIQKSKSNVALFGNNSYEIITGGTGSGDVNEAYSVSLIKGMKNTGYDVNNLLREKYLDYIKQTRENQPKPQNPFMAMFMGKPPVPEMAVSEDLATRMANESDVALITIGRRSGEGGDREAKPGDFYLDDTEKEMIKNVSRTFHEKNKQVVVVLNIGGVIETSSWRDHVDAILLAWQPGQEAGNSIADVVSGKVNPSGKLAVTFPHKYSDVPSSDYFPGQKVEGEAEPSDGGAISLFLGRQVPWEVVYEEDIFVGYRYYNTFDVPVAYEFGYGISYTDFDYSNLHLGSKSFRNEMKVSVTIENTGKVPGREVVQLYLSAPEGELKKPVNELVEFGKTRKLKPGESQTMDFAIKARDLAHFDPESSSWVATAGTYNIHVGASSKDFKQTAAFTLDEKKIIKRVNEALQPNRVIETRKP